LELYPFRGQIHREKQQQWMVKQMMELEDLREMLLWKQ
jgi:hypothetical protein